MTVSSSFPVGLPIDWQPASNIHNLSCDQPLKHWLLDDKSLTEKLEGFCHRLSVRVIGQQVAPVHDNEVNMMDTDDPLCVREVLLEGDDTPWVFARSLIPARLMENPDSEVARIGNQPLGRLLFNDARFIRGPFEVGQLAPSHLSLPELDSSTRQSDLWARRSVFSFESSRIMVAELFLPDAPAYESNHV